MPVIQFSHANGMPAKSYAHFFQQFGASYSFQYVEAMGLGNSTFTHWRAFSQELIQDIESHGQTPVIGMGHSLGALVTLWAAMERPELFSRVIMMDPPYLSKKIRRFIRWARLLGLGERIIPIARKANKRRDQFNSIEEARAYWSPKPFFKTFDPNCFEDYLSHSLVEKEDGGYELRIPKKLETRVFGTSPYKLDYQKGVVPVHWLVPEKSVIGQEGFEEHQKLYSDISFIRVKGSHMFPLEHPKETANLLTQLIETT